MPPTLPQLHNFDIDDFLQHYWQQRPLLIRQALPEFDNPITPDELAGYACEPDVESRIISTTNQDYQLSHGPFDEAAFASLGEKNWTLLVQAVDHFDFTASTLLDYFRFIPNWRIDDVMASYASPGGSVGPHYDNYDVFLVQGLGQRQWQVAGLCDHHTPLQEHSDLRLLQSFDADQQWLLEPGDILYLPPRYAHWGISQSDDCMTYSVGFRAPSHAELLSDFCDERLSALSEQQRFSDPHIKRLQHPGEISAEALDQVSDVLRSLLEDRQQLMTWFGRMMTRAKYQTHYQEPITTAPEPDADYSFDWQTEEMIVRNPAVRFATGNNHTASGLLFVDGQSYRCEQKMIELARLLADYSQYQTKQLLHFSNDQACSQLLQDFFAKGYLLYGSELLD